MGIESSRPVKNLAATSLGARRVKIKMNKVEIYRF